MGDVFDFRLNRPPQRMALNLGASLYAAPRRGGPAHDHLPVAQPAGPDRVIHAVEDAPQTFLERLVAAGPESRLASAFLASPAFLGPEVPLSAPLRELDVWLLGKQNRATSAEIDDVLDGATAQVVGAPTWPTLRQALGDSMLAAIAGRTTMEVRAELTRLILIAALLEDIADPRGVALTANDVFDRLRNRTIVLPQEVLSLTREHARLARRYGFSEYTVVREEWKEYRLGEIAHIENALAGELRKRVHQRTSETETTTSTETDTLKSEEHDTQTTDRVEMNEHAQTDVSIAAHMDGKVEVSGQFGPTKLDVQAGASFDYSRQDAREQATTLAHEVVARATKKVQQEVRTARSTREMQRYVETNTHVIDNRGDDAKNVMGIYRWVDKIQRLQAFHYPHRFLLEFEVPEPAAL